jgi:tRNA(Arg) A34 adenosine deaminase TadA
VGERAKNGAAVSEASLAWDELTSPWQHAFEQAWESWRANCFGIGAVIVDANGTIVSEGRNRVLETPTEPGVIAGTAIAHAEMNALAQLPLGPRDGYALYTTLEPCVMCASSIVLCHIRDVRFAAPDPLFDGLHDVLVQHTFCADRMPLLSGPLRGPFGALAQVLPLTFVFTWLPESSAADQYRLLSPAHVALAERILADGTLRTLADGGGTVIDAAVASWDALTVLAPR